MLCSSTNPNNRRTAWDAKDGLSGDTTVGVLGQRLDDSVQRIEGAALRKHTSVDSVVAKVAPGRRERIEIAGLVEIGPLIAGTGAGSGIRLLVNGIEIAAEKGFDGATLSEVLTLT